MRVRLVVAGLASVLALAGCGSSTVVTSTDQPDEPVTRRGQRPDPAPEGWRWETFRGVEVAVPGNWGTNGDGYSAWCLAKPTKTGSVGRPGIVPGIGCPEDPAKVSKTGRWVALRGALEENTPPDKADRAYVRLGSVMVVVQAERALREKIAATVREIGPIDGNGCPTVHAISNDPTWRPSNVPQFSELGNATAVSACRYELPRGIHDDPFEGPRLFSSTRVEGETARRALSSIAALPERGGPDQPKDCSEDLYGDEAIVLLAQRPGPDGVVVMRYSWCHSNGLDDGTALRPLTGDAAPFTAGANRPDHWSGSGKEAALSRPEPSAAALEKLRRSRELEKARTSDESEPTGR